MPAHIILPHAEEAIEALTVTFDSIASYAIGIPHKRLEAAVRLTKLVLWTEGLITTIPVEDAVQLIAAIKAARLKVAKYYSPNQFPDSSEMQQLPDKALPIGDQDRIVARIVELTAKRTE